VPSANWGSVTFRTFFRCHVKDRNFRNPRNRAILFFSHHSVPEVEVNLHKENQADAGVLPISLRNDVRRQSLPQGRSEFLFSRSNLIELFCETSGTGAAAVDRPEVRDFIASGLKYESILDFAQEFGVQCEQLLSEAEEVLERTLTILLICDLVRSCQTLLDEVWLVRANQPRQFKREIDKLLRHIGSLARSIYRVPNHRMPIREERDRELWRWKRMHPEWTWGQLGLKVGVSPGAAQLAYERQARREKLRLLSLHELLSLPAGDRADLTESGRVTAIWLDIGRRLDVLAGESPVREGV
jgi:hypothetical protein